MRQAQIGTQCVPIWKRKIKRTHIAQVSNIKALAKLTGQFAGEPLKLLFAIGSAGVALLFVFHNQAAYLPVGLHHGAVDRLHHLLAGSGNQLADLRHQPRAEIRLRFLVFFRHHNQAP